MRTGASFTDRAGSSAFPALAESPTQLQTTATTHCVSLAASPMACPNRKPSLSSLILLALMMAAAESGSAALKLEPTGTSSHFPPLLDCAPSPTARSDSKNGTAFRANVLSLLAALPTIAAAAPTGFAAATTRSGGAGRDRAFARALCFGLGAPRGGPSPGDCASCLSSAAQDVAGGCGAASRRAAVWRAGCFLSYADTDAPTAREDAFRGWFYDGDAPTAALGSHSQCAASRAVAECSRCLNESARVVPARVVGGRRLSMVRGDAVVVVGYGCYLRVPLFPPQPQWEQILFGFIDAIDVIAVVLIEVGGVLFCISEARELDPA